MVTPYGHLTYCSNIHAGESWKEHFRNLQHHIPLVKKAVSPDGAFGIGLRLSNEASEELVKEDTLRQFKEWLTANDCYLFTINGFPYGGFHFTKVKDGVHAPDWSTKERVDYTKRLTYILSQLLPDGMDGGISTSPLSYKYWHTTEEDRQQLIQNATANILDTVLYLSLLAKETGKQIHLDIEPEPDGMLGNGAAFMEWYGHYLLPTGITFLKEKLDVDEKEAERIIHEHICLCYDVCHFAVGYEDHLAYLQGLQQSGIKVGKIQISAALKAALASAESRQNLAAAFQPFNESTYLHQVIARQNNGAHLYYRDLPQALADIHNTAVQEWRAHFHVPLFIQDYGLLQSTRDDIQTVLNEHKRRPFTNHLEIETYTWEVLPQDQKLPLTESIIRELQWVQQLLQQP